MRQATENEIRDHFRSLGREVRIDLSDNVEVKNDGFNWSDSRTVGQFRDFKFDEENGVVIQF